VRADPDLIANAWRGRISGCQLGKPVELLSMRQGLTGLRDYLRGVDALPLRDYVPFVDGADVFEASCRGRMHRSEPDDDINYSVLALMMLEQHGAALETVDVARAWLLLLPFAATFTAERDAYRVLVNEASSFFAQGASPGFDLSACSDNEYNDWIGAQIRADLYGWVCPGDPAEAARLAAVDASLSHRDAGVHGAQFVAACGAGIPVSDSLDEAVVRAADELPDGCDARRAIELGRSLVGRDDAVEVLHAEYDGMSPVHTLNNLALVVWALLAHEADFGAAIGEAVAAGWDTDCNGATVGGLWGVTGNPIPAPWTDPWNGRVGVTLAGHDELALSALVDRTVAVAETLTASR
jgi:ADP-ribosylglycohydrolase